MFSRFRELFIKYREIINYLIFGVFTTIISLFVYYLLTFTVIDTSSEIGLQCANIISWGCGVVFAYFTNKRYVFNGGCDNSLKEFSSFVGGRIITLFMDMIIMFVGVSVLKGNDKIIKIVSQVVVIVLNYLFSKIFVFKSGK